jgi:hypothetical protein
MRLRRVGHDAVHVEQHGVELPRRKDHRPELLLGFVMLDVMSAHPVLFGSGPVRACLSARGSSCALHPLPGSVLCAMGPGLRKIDVRALQMPVG